MPKVDWKKIGKTVLGVGEQLFPVVGTIEKLAKFKQLTGKEKQDLAFEALHDELVGSLLPTEVQDPRVEASLRKMIDDAVAFNNLIAELRSQSGK